MSRASHARRVATAAAYGGGTVGAAGAVLLGVLAGEARLARHTVGEPTDSPPVSDGLYGDGVYGSGPSSDGLSSSSEAAGEPLVLAILGDSSAAGFGVDSARHTPGALIAVGLAEAAGRPVRLVNAATVGAQSADVPGQAAAVLAHAPQAAVIMVGANDVTHRVRPVNSVRHLTQAVRLLRQAGVAVVVGTCPDLGTVEPIAQPLRLVARRWSRALAAAQTIAVVEAGARTVSLADLLGPEFAAAPRVMFGADRFHPSASGYARLADALLPSVAAALGITTDHEPSRVLPGGRGTSSLAEAAAVAVEEPGTEVSGTAAPDNDAGTDGADDGPWGRRVVLRRRLRWVTRRPAGPEPEGRTRAVR